MTGLTRSDRGRLVLPGPVDLTAIGSQGERSDI